MKRTIALLILALSVSGMQSSTAATKVNISPQFKVSKKTPIITVKVSGLPAEHGIYLSQCMAPEKDGETPIACNPSVKSKLWVSSLPADIKMGAKSPKGKLTLRVDKYFSKGDCVHTTCVIYVTSDHNGGGDKSGDQQIPFKFGGLLPF